MFEVLEKITFWITDKCNLRCKYCLVRKKNTTLSFSDAKHLMDILMKSKKKKVYVNFSGGEPFVEYALIKRIIEYANKEAIAKKKTIKYKIITNGTILNKDIISMIKNNKIFITVSVDGSKKTHNKNRIFRNGKGSYDCIKGHIKKMQDENIDVNVTMVFNYNSNITRELNALLALRPENLYINLKIHNNYDSYEKKAYNKNKREVIIKKLSAWYVGFFEKNKKLPPISVLNRPLRRIYDYEKFGISAKKEFCSFGGGKYFCMNEKSELYPCFLYMNKGKFSFGTASNIDLIKYKMLRIATISFCLDFKGCEDCRANKICDKTMCPALNLFAIGDISESNFASCNESLFFSDVATEIWKKLKMNEVFLQLIKEKPREKEK